MRDRAQKTGAAKALLYGRIALHVAARYGTRPRVFRWNPFRYVVFLRRALLLLLAFRHDKPVRTSMGWKVHLYVPAFPSAAFFHTIEAKLLMRPPGPSTVVYSMTKACQYRCPHCYQRKDKGSDVEQDQLCAIARRLQDMGVAFFNIEGGEPFMRFDRLLHLVRALDSRSEIWINTTGDGATPERLKELKESGTAGLIVSIHSPRAAEHDAFCKVPGAFETACRCVRQAREAGLAVAFNSVLSQEGLKKGQLRELMVLADELGCHFVQLIHPKPSGGWLGRDDDMQRSELILNTIREAHLHYNSGASPYTTALAAQAFEEQSGVLGCTAGAIDRLYVNANGELQPCEFLNISFGNLTKEPFEEVYGRMRAAFPDARTDWLCCTQAPEIHRVFLESGGKHTPLPWERTRELVEGWDRGAQTPMYRKLGISRNNRPSSDPSPGAP
jgi:MoaA/NifB/PqqE/SkfB family radical SAM enzyme